MILKRNKHFITEHEGKLVSEASDLGWNSWPLKFDLDEEGQVDTFYIGEQSHDSEGELQLCVYTSLKTKRTFEVFND